MRPVTRSCRAVLVLGGVLTFAAPASVPAQPAPDRRQAPSPGPPPALTLPQIAKRQLSNGLAVWVVERHDVPVVQVDLVVRAGAGADPAEKPGVASLAADMLDEGAGARSALELADAIDFLGADLLTRSSWDASVVGLHVPVARLAPALELMADVARRPTFPTQELERLRQERLTQLLQARDDPRALRDAAAARVVFGPAHRYGTLRGGTEANVRAIGADDLRRFHGSYYRPANATLIVVGDATADGVLPLLERAFGDWRAEGPAVPIPAVAQAPQLARREVVIVDKPGAAQSAIAIGWVGVARTTPDYFPITVMNTILGGSFTSRLNQNLRETHGYAYGAGSSFDMRGSAGPFLGMASVQTDKTAESVREFFNEFAGIRKPIAAVELEKAKHYVALAYPGEFETTRDIAARLQELVVFGLPDDTVSGYVRRVLEVTASDVARVAARYVQPDRFAVIVVGDRKVVEGPIRALGLGPVRLISADALLGGSAAAPRP